MSTSIFPDKNLKPGETDLKSALSKMYSSWIDIKKYAGKKYPDALEEWAYPGKSFGWNFRIKDKKRVIIYMMPCDKFFKVSFVYGAKATEEAMKSQIQEEVKYTISSAKVYAEGRGFRIDVKNRKMIKDVKKLIDIKLAY